MTEPLRLEWRLHWCREHLEPLRPYVHPKAKGRRDVLVRAMTALAEEAFSAPSVLAAHPKLPDGTYDGPRQETLDALAPLCCLLDEPALGRLYRKAIGLEVVA